MSCRKSVETTSGRRAIATCLMALGLMAAVSRAETPTPIGQAPVVGVERARTADKGHRLAAEGCGKPRWLGGRGEFPVTEALESIAECAAAVGRQLESLYPDAPELAQYTRDLADELVRLWHAGDQVSPAYQETLEVNFEVLRGAASNPATEQAYSILSDVVEDLRIKAENCKNGGGMTEDTWVEVRTQRDGQDDPDWQVYYMRPIDKYRKGFRPLSFPGLTSPAKQKIAAAEWLIWAEKTSEDRMTQTEEKRIILDTGESTYGVVLPVPK